MTLRIKLTLSLATLALALATTTNRAADPAPLPAGDELLRVARSGFLTRALPYGPDRPGVGEFSEGIDELAFLPDGRRVAITYSPAQGIEKDHIFLNRIAADGTVSRIGEVALLTGEILGNGILGEQPVDLKADAAGRLFLLTSIGISFDPREFHSRLVELDPDDASTVSSRLLERETFSIAAAPHGLWGLTVTRVVALDPDTGEFGLPGFSIENYGAVEIDSDSTGAVWFWQEGVCSPPCSFFHRVDPATGAIALGFGPTEQNLGMQDLVIHRRCTPGDTARCLQGGRFRAELTWTDFAGQSGSAKVAAGGSADTGLFYFFEPKNWELMVKVLNGCEENGHFWVYGSASTTVEYTLTVRDLETGAVRTYGNPLGEAAEAITDSTAFACPAAP